MFVPDGVIVDLHFYADLAYMVEDMEKFAVTETDLRDRKISRNIRDLVEYEWNRAGEYFRYAEAEILGSDRRNFFPAEVMGSIYHLLWQEIQNRNSALAGEGRDGFVDFR